MWWTGAIDLRIASFADTLNGGGVEIDGQRYSPDSLPENISEATDVRLFACRDLARLPDLPAARVVVINDCHQLAEIPQKLPAATHVQIWNCRNLCRLPALPAATHVTIKRLPKLAELPEFPSGEKIYVGRCESLPFSAAAVSSHGNQFVGAKVQGVWNIIVGLKSFTIGEARQRWGKNTNPVRPDGDPEALALCEEVFSKIVATHPEALGDQDVIIDPFHRHDWGAGLYGLLSATERNVRAIVNAARTMRGEAPLPPRKPQRYDPIPKP